MSRALPRVDGAGRLVFDTHGHRALRKALEGKTAVELGNRIGVSHQAISKLAAGLTRYPSYVVADELERHEGIPWRSWRVDVDATQVAGIRVKRELRAAESRDEEREHAEPSDAAQERDDECDDTDSSRELADYERARASRAIARR